jgi:hypothetical protein
MSAALTMRRYEVLSRNDFMQLEVPPIVFLVDGILVSGSATLFSAREKAGKGLFLIDLAVSIATGTPFLDRAVMEGSVIYAALEENAATIQNRLRARDKGDGGYPLYVLRLDGSVEGQEFQLDRNEDIAGLLELIEEIQPVLVIIDPLREAHSGRENESDDMAPRLRAIRAVSHQTNTAIIVSHHAGKASGTFRGSTAIRASFDDELQFTREDNDTESGIRGVLRAEGRNLQKVVEHIAFNSDDFRWVVTSAPPVEIVQNMRRRILHVLHDSDDWMDAKALADAIPGAKLGSIQNELTRMLREKPRPFAVNSKSPRKGAPRKYHGMHSREIVHNASVTNSVNDDASPVDTLDLVAGEVVF